MIPDPQEPLLAAFRTRLGDERFAASRFALAARLFEDLVTNSELEDFLTLAAYPHLDDTHA